MTYDSERHYENIGDTMTLEPLNDEPECPYCGALLEQRNTYGIGGDECYEYCSECEKIIME